MRLILKKKNKKHKQGGFSLIELSVILSVAGVATATMLSTTQVDSESTSVVATADHFDEIEIAIRAYYEQFGALPCPARPKSLPNSAYYGRVSDCAAAAPGGTGVVDATPSGGGANEVVRVGSLPVRCMGLPDSYMYDRWGSRISYAIVKKLGNPVTFPGYTTGMTNGVVEVTDATGTTLSNSDVTGYVLFSHGKDRKGAYSKTGIIINACDTTQREGENCDSDPIFVDALVNETPGTDYFYDMPRWKTVSAITGP